MQITIILNCYNSEKYISETANSISSQSFTEFEVLFVDNQSTDRSFEIFKNHCNFKYKYLSTPIFMSLYDARNFAISHVTSPIVCFLDADDLWSPFYLQDIFLFHVSNPNFIACQSRVISFGFGRISQEITKNFKNKECIRPIKFSKSPFTALSGLSLKKKYFENYTFPNGANFIGDLDLVLSLSISNQLYFLENQVFYYRIHDNSLTSSKINIWHNELSDWLKINQKKMPLKLRKRFQKDLNYLNLRILLKDSNFIHLIKKMIFIEINFIYKIKIIFRKIFNKY